MKIRSDFVSNSSSSSFIFWQTEFIEHFNITKKDIEDALISLYGRDKYDEFLSKHTYEAGQAEIAKCRKEGDSDEDVKWAIDLYTSKDFLECKPFYIYDLEDEDDAKAAREKFGFLLSGWDQRLPARSEMCDTYGVAHNIETFQGFLEAINEAYSTYLHLGTERELKMATVAGSDYELAQKLRKIPLIGNLLEHKIAIKHLPKSIQRMVLKVRNELGIKTNYEILQDECSRFFIHFEDNEMCNLLGMNKKGKNDDYGFDGEDLTLETEAYSCDRFMEILLREWIKSGRVKVDDVELLKRYSLAEDCRKSNPSKISWLPNDKYDVETFIQETVATCNGHEG